MDALDTPSILDHFRARSYEEFNFVGRKLEAVESLNKKISQAGISDADESGHLLNTADRIFREHGCMEFAEAAGAAPRLGGYAAETRSRGES